MSPYPGNTRVVYPAALLWIGCLLGAFPSGGWGQHDEAAEDETPVSDETLSADAGIARRRALSIWVFVLVSGLIPAAAALSIIA